MTGESLLEKTLANLDPDGTLRTRVTNKGEAQPASPAVSSWDGELPPLDRRIARARRHLAKIPGAVQGSNGSKPTLYAARVLVRGYLIDAQTALGLLLSDYNPKCDPPWSVRELEHKISDAESKPFSKPPGWLLAEKSRGATSPTAASPTAPSAAASDQAGHPAPSAPADAFLNEADDDPHRLARSVLAGYQNAGRRTLVYWRGEFHEWDRSRYRTLAENEFRATINRTIHRELAAVQKTRLENHDGASGAELPKMPKVTRVLAGNVVAALEGLCILRDVPDAPAWLADAGPDPRDLVATDNGLVHLSAYAEGRSDAVIANTPHYLNFNAVTFAADRTAAEPVEWLKFLGSLWPDDAECVALLQEWFGYLLTPDTRQQKMLLMVGPKRSGKGTIGRILQELVGLDNCCNPTLGILGTPFGLSSLVGKSVAVIEDARLSARSDVAAITERLLTISGEGRIDVDRKHRDIITGRLSTRFVVATNELPRLSDASGALASRWCVLRFIRSFFGEEDETLYGRLVAELSGIFNWAVAGWKRLREQRRFTQPKSVADMVEDLDAVGSPIGEFVRERCEVGPRFTAEVDELYAEWKRWCESNGKKECGTKARFGVDLRAVVPTLTKSRPETSEGRIHVYRGIRLKQSGWGDSDEPESYGAVEPRSTSSLRFGEGEI